MASVSIREGLSGGVVPDSWVDSADTGANHGSDDSLDAGFIAAKAGSTRRALLEFDLSAAGIPAGATIDAAQLDLVCNLAAASAESARVNRLTQQGWVEAEVTWNDYKTVTAWAVAGGDFTTTDEVTWTLPTSTGSFTITGLATLTQDGLDNRGGKLEAILKRQTESGADSFARFRSGEWSASERPTLVVEYSTGIAVFRRRIEGY